jgi:RNA polymerase sporulation-specific sigma factor
MGHIVSYSSTPSPSDEVLCARAASGDRIAEEELVVRYSRLVRICARPFFLAGGDSEDLIQEGMLGLLSAIRSFQPEKAASFRTFAEVCIKSRLISAVRSASSGKHSPLNSYISFETPSFADFSPFMSAGLPQKNPEDVLISREELQEHLDAAKDHLSGFEANVLAYYLEGLSYQEIATELDRSAKSVDNAVQRIRRKLVQHFSSGEISTR